MIIGEPVITNRDKPSGLIAFTYNLTVGIPARLNVTTSGSPTPSLTLYKKNEATMEYVEFTSERFTVSLIGITISPVEPEDEGDYQIFANYTFYNDSEEFTIILNSNSKLPPHHYNTCVDSVFTHILLLCV